MLKSWFDFKELIEFSITGSKTQSPVMIDVDATIRYRMGEIHTATVTARVIREVAPYKPSSSGTWGVNPLTVLKEQ